MRSQEEFIKMLEVCECALDNVQSSLESNLKMIKETAKEFDIQKETKKSIDDFSDREKELLLTIGNKVESVYNLIEKYNNL